MRRNHNPSHFFALLLQVSGTYDAFVCFGPLVNDGYGVCYNLMPNQILAGLGARKHDPETNVDGFRQVLGQSLQDMHDLCLFNAQKSKL